MKLLISVLLLFSFFAKAEVNQSLFDSEGNVDGFIFYKEMLVALQSEIDKSRAETRKKKRESMCSEVSEEAKRVILDRVAYVSTKLRTEFYNIKNMNAGRLIEDIAMGLECHPQLCPKQDGNSLFGAVCNAGAYNGDLDIVSGAIKNVFGFEMYWNQDLGYNVRSRLKKQSRKN